MLKIYGHAGSINVQKVLWLCEELDLGFTREDWGGSFRSTSDAAFLTLNPFGMIPVIDDGGFVRAESNAILRYLATSRARSDLLPTEAKARAQIESWMDWQVSDFNNSWRAVFGSRRRWSDRNSPMSRPTTRDFASGPASSAMAGTEAREERRFSPSAMPPACETAHRQRADKVGEASLRPPPCPIRITRSGRRRQR